MTQETALTISSLRATLAGEYQKQIENYFGNKKQALQFLSGVIAAAQTNPKLLECTPLSVINSFMTMAQLGLMPSNVSGEAYVIPYRNNKENTTVAQFQLGYQGIVTLFYRSGMVKDIKSEIVRENDKFTYVNGNIKHKIDPFAERGAAKGVWVTVRLMTGGEISKVFSKQEVLGHAKRFSRSFADNNSPWNEANDPELWMWKKTALKQCAKLVPKSGQIFEAIAKDNEESTLHDEISANPALSSGITMGALAAGGTEDVNE